MTKFIYTYTYTCTLLILLILSLGMSSCQKGGADVTGPDDPDTPPAQSQISSSFENENTSFLPGQIRFITVEGHSLQEDEYEADITDGMAVTLYRYTEDTENKTLVFLVPEETPEDHTLLFTLGEQEQSLDFTVNEYEIIENPKQTINDFSSELSTELNTLYQNETNSETRVFLQENIDRLDEEIKKIEDLSDKEISLLARIITTNYSDDSSVQSKQKALSQQTVCSELKSTIILQNAIIVTAGISAIMSVDSIFLGGGLISAIVGGVSLGTLAVTLEFRFKNGREYKAACKEAVKSGLFSSISQKMKSSDIFNFNHGKSKNFLIKTDYDLKDEDKSLFTEIRDIVTKLSDLLPEKWVTSLLNSDFEETKIEDAIGYSVENISDSNIDNNISVADTVVSLTFSFQDESIPTEERSFTFSMGNEETSFGVEATLSPPLPIAFDNQLSVRIDNLVTGSLQADYAATFAIESQPTHGTVTLLDETTGKIEYTPNNTITGGTDTFTFSATNSGGTSETATVTVELINPFAGTWEMDTFENGTPIGQYVIFFEEVCNIAISEWTITWETLDIGVQSWAFSGNYTLKSYNLVLDLDTCTILEDNADTIENNPYSESGTYTRNGDLITTNVGGETVTGEIIFINENKIKIADLTYVRQ